MVTHSSILAWKILCNRGALGLQSVESQRGRHSWAHMLINVPYSLCVFFFHDDFPELKVCFENFSVIFPKIETCCLFPCSFTWSCKVSKNSFTSFPIYFTASKHKPELNQTHKQNKIWKKKKIWGIEKNYWQKVLEWKPQVGMDDRNKDSFKELWS